MAQYDLLFTQNVAAAGIEFSEKYVLLNKGSILTSDGATKTPYAVAVGTDGMVLKANSAVAGGLEWVAQNTLVGANSHAQNTDTGTTSNTFEIGSGGNKIEVTAESTTKASVKVDGGGTYADFQAKDGTFNKITISGAPAGNTTDAATTAYVDAKVNAGFAANNAMVYKGSIGAGGTWTIDAFNALLTYDCGWTYRVIQAGTIKGVVCEIGDLVETIVSRAGSANDNATDFTMVQTNIDGAVIGPASTTDNYVALFSGATGKLLKAGSGALGDAAYTNASDYATAAQGTLATNAIPKGTITAADQIVIGTAASTPSVITIGASQFVGKKATGTVVGMTVAEAKAVLAYGTAANNNTGDFDAAGVAATAVSNHAAQRTGIHGISVAPEKLLVVLNGLALSASVDGCTLNIGNGGTLGSAAFTDSTAYATAAQGTLATNAIPKGIITEANQIVIGTAASTPSVITIAAASFVGRKAAGSVGSMTVAEAMALLWQTAPATYNADATAVGLLARDAGNNFIYVSTTAGTAGAGRWKRFPMATNW